MKLAPTAIVKIANPGNPATQNLLKYWTPSDKMCIRDRYKAMPSKGREEYLYDDKALEQYRKTHKGNFTLQRYKGLGEMDAAQLWETTLNPETRILKKVEIEDARIASDITGLLMGPDVPPRKAFIYKHAHDAELDI